MWGVKSIRWVAEWEKSAHSDRALARSYESASHQINRLNTGWASLTLLVVENLLYRDMVRVQSMAESQGVWQYRCGYESSTWTLSSSFPFDAKERYVRFSHTRDSAIETSVRWFDVGLGSSLSYQDNPNSHPCRSIGNCNTSDDCNCRQWQLP